MLEAIIAINLQGANKSSYATGMTNRMIERLSDVLPNW